MIILNLTQNSVLVIDVGSQLFISGHFFFAPPLCLIPCCPVLSGPLPPALEAMSLRAFSSAKRQSQTGKGCGRAVPAAFLALNAISSSSMSFLSFFGAFKGLTFPPVTSLEMASQGWEERTFSALATHCEESRARVGK